MSTADVYETCLATTMLRNCYDTATLLRQSDAIKLIRAIREFVLWSCLLILYGFVYNAIHFKHKTSVNAVLLTILTKNSKLRYVHIKAFILWKRKMSLFLYSPKYHGELLFTYKNSWASRLTIIYCIVHYLDYEQHVKLDIFLL